MLGDAFRTGEPAQSAALQSSAHTYRLRIFKERVLRPSLAEADGVRCSGRRRSKLDRNYDLPKRVTQDLFTSISSIPLQKRPLESGRRDELVAGIGFEPMTFGL